MTEAEVYIDRYYWKEPGTDEEMSDAALKGMLYSLGDKYSQYYTKNEYDETMNHVEGDYAGIGATISIDLKTLKKTIKEVQKDSPAEKAGILAGDILTHVNGTDVTKNNLDDTVNMIRGKEGKKNELTLIRTKDDKTETVNISVTAEKIVNQSVASKMLESDIGYIRISSFDNQTMDQFRQQLKALEEKEQKGLIIDLRDNGGGSLEAVVDIVNQILPEGKIMTEENKAKGTIEYKADNKEHFDKPMAVLINGSSASASEVMAGALQDYKKATLVGEKSFGKGIVQSIFNLKQGGGLKLTTGEYLLPSGRCIHEKGLTPDVEVKYTGTSKIYCDADDNQLQKAIEELRKKVEE